MCFAPYNIPHLHDISATPYKPPSWSTAHRIIADCETNTSPLMHLSYPPSISHHRDVILFTITSLSNTPKRFAMFMCEKYLKAEMHNTSIVKSRRALAGLAQMGEKLRRPPELTRCASLQSSIMCICTGAVIAVQGREIAEKLRWPPCVFGTFHICSLMCEDVRVCTALT